MNLWDRIKSHDFTAFRKKSYRFGPGLFIAFLVSLAVYNTTMNNAYQYGSTFFDSAEFATVIWRSGIRLDMGPAFAGTIYSTHASTINYIPSLFSHLWTGDRMDFYALVYSLVYAAMVYAVYIVILPFLPRRFGPLLAALGMILFFCGQIMYDGAWEMRSDYMSPLFMILAFRSWQMRNYSFAVVWFTLNNMVREDLGMMIIVPVALLAGLQYWEVRRTDAALARERLLWGIRICAISFTWAIVTSYVQKNYFPFYDLFQDQYYDRVHPFAHLSLQIISDRFAYFVHYDRGIWLPVLILAFLGLCCRDWQLMVGAVAFLPYGIAMFFAKNELSWQLGSYKPFVFALMLVWPCIIAYTKPVALYRRYILIQAVVLLCGVSNIRAGFIDSASHRWLLQPLTYNAQLYRDFGAHELKKEQSPGVLATRVSHSILALYPYQFKEYWNTWIISLKPEDAGKVETLIWFEGDRDQPLIDKVLKSGEFTVKPVEGTKIRIAHRHNSPWA